MSKQRLLTYCLLVAAIFMGILIFKEGPLNTFLVTCGALFIVAIMFWFVVVITDIIHQSRGTDIRGCGQR